MASREENKGLNLVIVHKETRWKKFKGRITSWFTSDKPAVETVVVPEIIVTSAGDTSGMYLLYRLLGKDEQVLLFCIAIQY